jgi:hypothetical protein
LFKLFEPADDDDSVIGEMIARRPVLKDLERLEAILGAKPFNLTFLQNKLENLIQTWNTKCFGGTEATLFKLKYSLPSCIREAQTQQSKARAVAQGSPIRSPVHRSELSSLRRGRTALRDEHGEDPLEVSRKIAEKTTGVARAQAVSSSRKKKKRVELDDDSIEEDSPSPLKKRAGPLYENKQTKGKITFDDSDEEEDDESYDEEEDDGSPVHRSELSSLRRGRTALSDEHGEDPLEESREIAGKTTGVAQSQAVSSKREKKKRVELDDESIEEDSPLPKKKRASRLYGNKQTKGKITFDDSDEEKDDESYDEEEHDDGRKKRAKLSHLPKKWSVRNFIGRLKYYPPDEGRFDAAGHVLIRTPYDEDEDNAIIAGLEKYGPGNWAQIKEYHNYILRNRTNQMIKDRYRNLVRLGIVEPPAPAEGGGDNPDEESRAQF